MTLQKIAISFPPVSIGCNLLKCEYTESGACRAPLKTLSLPKLSFLKNFFTLFFSLPEIDLSTSTNCGHSMIKDIRGFSFGRKMKVSQNMEKQNEKWAV